MNPSRVTPIILAAGASTRMGRCKALLTFDGPTALELAIDALGGLGRPIVVLGAHRAEIEARVPLRDVDVALNLDPDSGSTASLRAGLARLPAEAEGFAFLPVDCPLAGREDVDLLLAALGPGTSIAIPSHAGRRGHPVICRRAIADEILALPPGAPARDAIARDPARIAYALRGAHILMDMDRPEDYARCLDVHRARRKR